VRKPGKRKGVVEAIDGVSLSALVVSGMTGEEVIPNACFVYEVYQLHSLV